MTRTPARPGAGPPPGGDVPVRETGVEGAPWDPDPRIERTRARVLAATTDLLLEHGFDHVTIDDIATRSGVARSTIYRNWPQRPRLFLDALRNLIKDADPVDGADLPGSLRTALAVLLDALNPANPLGRLLPSLIAAADRDPQLAELHRTATGDRLDALTRILNRAVAAGDLPPDTDTGTAATFLTATLYYRRLITGQAVTADAAATLIDQVITHPPRRPRR